MGFEPIISEGGKAADPRFRPRGHCDRLTQVYISLLSIDHSVIISTTRDEMCDVTPGAQSDACLSVHVRLRPCEVKLLCFYLHSIVLAMSRRVA